MVNLLVGEGCSGGVGGQPGANIGLILVRCILMYGRTCRAVGFSSASVLHQRQMMRNIMGRNLADSSNETGAIESAVSRRMHKKCSRHATHILPPSFVVTHLVISILLASCSKL